MEIHPVPEASDTIMQWLKLRLKELSGPRSEGIHLTQLIYCLSRSWWDQVMPLEVSDEAAMTMGMGIGLERMLVKDSAKAPAGVKDGIHYSPDIVSLAGQMVELKTTRTSIEKIHRLQFPETWIQQMMGYCYAEGRLVYDLIVWCLLGNYKPAFPARPESYRFEFTQEELQSNWATMLYRRDVLKEALDKAVMPTPGAWCLKWECKGCQYAERCGR